MRILHISSVTIHVNEKTSNGIKTVIEELSFEQRKLGNVVEVVSLSENAEWTGNEFYHFFENLSQVKKYIMEFKPDVVIMHALYYMNYIKLGRFLNSHNIPYLIELHGAASKENLRKNAFKKNLANALLFNRLIKKAHGVIFLNEAEKSNFGLLNHVTNPIIIPNGIHLTDISHSKVYRTKPKLEILFLSRIAWIHKGLDVLMDAISSLNDEGFGNLIHFTFYGPLRSPGDFLLRMDELGSIVEYKGLVTGEEKQSAFKEADLFILTSRYEGMPMSVLEALNEGCPCILTYATNMADVVTDNKCGWVCETDAQQIVNTIKRAIEEFKLNPDFYINNTYKAVQSFSWELIAKESIRKYEESISLK